MPSRTPGKRSARGPTQGGYMSTFSTRTLAALAFERGEESDPALTLPSAPLAEELVLLAGAQAMMCELSPMKRRPARARAPRCVRGRAERDVARQPATDGAEVRRRHDARLARAGLDGAPGSQPRPPVAFCRSHP